jgi:transposase
MSYREIAEKVGCSKRTVIRAVQAIKPTLAELGGDQMEEYRKLVKQQLPDSKAVEALEKSMKDVRFCLPAIKYRDEILGVAPAKQLETPPEQKPMFMFGPGSALQVDVIVRQASASPEPERSLSRQQIIDVTPAKDGSEPGTE